LSSKFVPRTETNYILYQLESDATQIRIDRSVVGTTRLEFSIAALRDFVLPIPERQSEQRAIATALSDVDALISGLERLIAKKRDIKQAAMQQLLTGKTRLPGFEGEWEVENVGNLASISTGGKNTQDRVEDGEYPFFVRSQTVERINSYSFDGEAVLTAGDGVGTGKVFHYINGKFDVHQRVYRISNFNQRLSGYFFYLYFSTNFYNRIMQMTAKSSVDSVRMDMIARMPIPIPPTKAEQTAIATLLSDLDAELTALQSRLSKTRALKQGMMQELLTGKTRLNHG
jgi:type I restriction enzyme S subunit